MVAGLRRCDTLTISEYNANVIPGLLQTADYARHVIGLAPWPAAEIERRIDLRLRRQRLLVGPDAPILWAVVEESALRRQPGPPAVRRAQLKYLAEAAERPNITLQLVPTHFTGHPVTGVPFSVLRFAEPDLPDVVYIEQLTGALYLDKRTDVSYYVAALDSLCAQVLTPDQTRAALHELIDEV